MTLEQALVRIEHNIALTKSLHSSTRTMGALLSVLVASKPQGLFLELGTGLGMGTAHMWAGMDADSYLITVDTHKAHSLMAQEVINDLKVEFRLENAINTLEQMPKNSFDLIFVDTAVGKLQCFDEVWALLKVGGVYVIEELVPQSYWPALYAAQFAHWLHKVKNRPDALCAQLAIENGVLLATKR